MCAQVSTWSDIQLFSFLLVKKKKKKKKPEDTPSAGNSSSGNAKTAQPKGQSKGAKKTPAPSELNFDNLSPEELEKRIKNLKKKVREIKTLEQKIESGEIKNPEKDQLEKLQRKPDLLSEIMALKLSLHGEEGEGEGKDDWTTLSSSDCATFENTHMILPVKLN